MDVALSGQWSGMPSFSLIIYSYFSIKVFIVNIWSLIISFFDKSVYSLNFRSQSSPVSKSTMLLTNASVLFYYLTGDYGWMLHSGKSSGMPSFPLIIYSYF